jgi:hypothetical protein
VLGKLLVSPSRVAWPDTSYILAASNLVARIGLAHVTVGEDNELESVGAELGKKETPRSRPTTYGWVTKHRHH